MSPLNTASGSHDAVDRRSFLKGMAGGALAALSMRGSNVLADDDKDENDGDKRVEISTKDMAKLVKSRLRWVDAGEALKPGDDCVDPRLDEEEDTTGIVGVPGGGAGIAVAALQTAESLTKEKITQKHVSTLVHEYPDTFSFHTDEHGVHNIVEMILRDKVLSKYAKNDKEAMALIKGGVKDPDAEKRLTSIMTITGNQGCGHIKHLLMDPKGYNADATIMRTILEESISGQHKGSAHEHMHILKGDHVEGAVLEVQMPNGIHSPKDKIPVFDRVEDKPFFVVTGGVVGFRAEEMWPIMQKMFPKMKKGEFLAETSKLFGHQTLETAKRLAGEKPHFVLEANPTKWEAPDESWKLKTAPRFATL